ncbi:GNAT family N-acetyltransferase [Rhizobium bangladeshense]|uniref:GNAT family N-acetyltransferase n=1 Tax=Rhizobium bangladeshense TaxID=1138189 RepID=UPI001C828E25|nr:GNAT family N-acetyltransferase [Rhizobium bangladeshense]MBX4892280.1 GNAT family N-acetyltransferase [Rhizobium bangladeshense]MBX4897947.1 GNAT family N-acetyltransferase [Rhizobium bangladeshense]MBX4901431.1 GNAT family N-acetyltransferase [Rhizobium bangladeshense]MBX4915518.1 GNAT family N-acetyltransferase [Rhizobium bangladeshense]MBY3614717.1 GNAT family N-acetyltransferase [Rhizobium bangladeshense]
MSALTSESRLVDSFETRMIGIDSVDLDKLHALSMSVAWPHRREDWQFLREFGQGVAAIDEIGRILGSAMWFPYDDRFATIGMVITSPRLQANGAGQWLMGHALNQVADRNLGLNATRAARRLYLSLDFVLEAPVFQCQGEAILPPDVGLPAGAVVRPVDAGDMAAIAELDSLAFGTDRTALLARLMAHSKGVVLVRAGRIEAFSLCRRFGRGQVVGPVVACSDADAIAVVHPHALEHAGSFLRLDTREKAGIFADFLSRCGLAVYDFVTTMSLGDPWLPVPGRRAAHQPKTYALVSQALG